MQVYSLKKAVPAIAGGVTLIDLFISSNINKGIEVSLEMPPGYFQVLLKHIPKSTRSYVFIQIMNWRLNLVYLHLNNLFMGIGQRKDLDRDANLFQGQDFVQNKGL